MKLTLGMAFYDDFDGVYFTLQALGLYHGDALDGCEILLVDNHPDSPGSKRVQGLGAAWTGASREMVPDLGDLVPNGIDVRYVPAGEVTGTSAPRDLIFTKASHPAVVCIDSHVLLAPGAIRRLREYYRAHPTTGDLLTGPRLADNLRDPITHFGDFWRGDMWGIWMQDRRGLDPDGPPFEIGAHGLGLFSCRKEAWLGFNEHFRGFGGEEWYIHEKFRQAGQRCLSLPFLRWTHRFGRSGQYPLALWQRVRNYVLGHQELGLPLERVHRHFVAREPERMPDGSTPAMPPHRLTEKQWEYLLADPVAHEAPEQQECGGCGGKAAGNGAVRGPQSLEAWYQEAATTPSDINEHVPMLRTLASQCRHVTEFGVRSGVSTVGLLAGQPRWLISYDRQENRGAVRRLEELSGKTTFQFRQADTTAVEIDKTDMLFIDTRHTAAQLTAELLPHNASRVKRWLVLHDTQIYGEKGEDGGPGLLVALRPFLRAHPEWSVIAHYPNNHGLTVLSRSRWDKPRLPKRTKMAATFMKAVARHVATGAKQTGREAMEARLKRCTLCEQRTDRRCAVCGCFVDEKAAWAEQVCPLGRWDMDDQ